MKLGAIITVWGDCYELIEPCIKNILKSADQVLLIWSITSNKGVDDHRMEALVSRLKSEKVLPFRFDPYTKLDPQANEMKKRNFGVSMAYEQFCTHFIMMDGDEFYIADQLNMDKERFARNEALMGMVHPVRVFVGKPTLSCEDHTLVPGIHKLERHTMVGNYLKYPFAYDSQGRAHIDPTRRVNITHGVIHSDHYMFHMSYVRKEIDLKIENSSANLVRSKDMIHRELANAHPGYISEIYHRPLVQTENYFNL